MILPVSGSSPPQKLSGSVRCRIEPWQSPSTSIIPTLIRWLVTDSVPFAIGNGSGAGGVYACLQVAERDGDTQGAGRIVGSLRRVGHYVSVASGDGRSVIRAAVGNDMHADGLQVCQKPFLFKLG